METIVRTPPKAIARSTAPHVVDIPATTYLVVAGEGSPEGPEFQKAVGALYSVAWTLKMELKNEGGDFKIAPLEALWWVDDGSDFMTEPRGSWHWKALMGVPSSVDAQLVKLTKESLVNKRGKLEAADVYLEELHEGRCVEVLHVGPYSAEGKSIGAMREFMTANNFKAHGPHHEIYLSDPRRTAPERLRTVLRQPVV